MGLLSALERHLHVGEAGLTPRDRFEAEGFCVIRNALEEADALALLNDIRSSWDARAHFSPNMVEFLTSSGPLQVTKPNIFEFDLHKKELRDQLPAFKRLFDVELVPLIDALNAAFPQLALRGGSSDAEYAGSVAKALTVKLQVNTGGGCFPWHYDNPAPPNCRKLTLACYLTPDHNPDHDGGEIALMPFLREPTFVPPSFNTLVLFRSDLINHRVMPMHPDKSRFCFTIWFDSANVNADDEVNLRAKHLTREYIPTLMASPVQRALSRAVYDVEYRAALVDCFGDGSKECLLSLRLHEAHLKPLLGNPALGSFVDELIRLKPASPLLVNLSAPTKDA